MLKLGATQENEPTAILVWKYITVETFLAYWKPALTYFIINLLDEKKGPQQLKPDEYFVHPYRGTHQSVSI